MGIDEFERDLEKKIEQERDAERQRMLRELKHTKVKKKENTLEMLANAHMRKRDVKAEQKVVKVQKPQPPQPPLPPK